MRAINCAMLAARMEQHYQDNRFYTTTAATTTCGITMPSATESPYFSDHLRARGRHQPVVHG